MFVIIICPYCSATFQRHTENRLSTFLPGTIPGYYSIIPVQYQYFVKQHDSTMSKQTMKIPIAFMKEQCKWLRRKAFKIAPTIIFFYALINQFNSQLILGTWYGSRFVFTSKNKTKQTN